MALLCDRCHDPKAHGLAAPLDACLRRAFARLIYEHETGRNWRLAPQDPAKDKEYRDKAAALGRSYGRCEECGTVASCIDCHEVDCR